VHSDPDAGLPFVREADHAVRLPGATPADTYLRGDLIVDAARRAGADAVHPGYGFLAESAGFARAVIDAGLTWVGPAPESMEQMATKVEAKKLMEAAGVPVLAELAPEAITEADLPVLVKASAGGGGRGMRVVRTLIELPAVVEQASNEAASAFGDPTVFCEPYVEQGRHIEVQVVGDTHGTVLVLGERDCSVQRRHQKVIEESPAPGISEALRAALHDAARTAAQAISYVGAGTVELLVVDDRFFFLEMNTRLQVEHPVTECVTGLDVVALQIAVAEGDRLPPLGTGPGGHAIEARLYAEDPARDWQPQSGPLHRLDVPGVVARFENPRAHGIRLDSGFESGSEVGTHYDAMLAKVVAWAPTRGEATRRLAAALRGARIHGPVTNRDLLVEVLASKPFLDADVSTAFLTDVPLPALEARAGRPPAGVLFAAAVAVTESEVRRRRVQRRVPAGWRNVVSTPQVTRFEAGGDAACVRWFGGRDGYRLAGVDEEAHEDVRVTSVEEVDGAWRVVVEEGGVARPYDVTVHGDEVDVDSADAHVRLTRRPRFTDPAESVAAGSLLAPMPGTVVAVHASAGDRVTAGESVLVLEAMKMQHTIVAPHEGTVADLAVRVGDQVAAGAVLAVVVPPDPEQSGETS
jgi:propionyl-CoA carboxylase alpha chain